MRVAELVTPGPIENVRLGERPVPQPGPGQVLVRVKATSLNHRDLGVIARGFPGNNNPLILLSDGAGEVTACGPGVSQFKNGDRVMATFNQSWLAGEVADEFGTSVIRGGMIDGMAAEYAAISEEHLVRVPDHLSYEEASTLPCAGLTAWHALVTEGRVSAGETVLVEGTGGVSIFGLQFARMHGARVIVTSSSGDKIKRAIALGAAEGINYREQPDWGRRARELTRGRGVDQLLEVGGIRTFPQALEAMRTNGSIWMIGVLTGTTTEIDLAMILRKRLNVRGMNVGSREMFRAMARAVAASGMRPVVDRVFRFDQVHEALHYLDAGSHFGKVVMTID